MRVIADEGARASLAAVDAVYVRSRSLRCCAGRQHVLETTLADDGGDYVERGRVGPTRILLRRGLRLPEELHLALDRRGRLQAYWDGQGWIG